MAYSNDVGIACLGIPQQFNFGIAFDQVHRERRESGHDPAQQVQLPHRGLWVRAKLATGGLDWSE
jgi:hypothetical protein